MKLPIKSGRVLITMITLWPMFTSFSVEQTALSELQLINLDNKTVRLDLENKVTLMVFWATWCSPCKDEMPELQKLSNQLTPKFKNRFQLIGINVGKSLPKARQFIKKLNIKFDNYIDIDERLSDRFEVTAMPFTLLIDHNSKSIHHFQGYMPEDIDKYKKLIENYLTPNPSP